MPDFDPANEAYPSNLVVRGGKPTVAELKAALANSDVVGSYSEAWMNTATKNDLIYAVHIEGIEVPGI